MVINPYSCKLTLLYDFGSTEWLRTDARRTAIGLDLDIEALKWCMESNLSKVGADVYSRIFLFHGNVLEPLQATLVNFDPQDLGQRITLEDCKDGPDAVLVISSTQGSLLGVSHKLMKDTRLPERDIVCAFNYSCCCLHKRQELVLYFKYALSILNKRGGIFVMDLYGGTSSECQLRMQRRFPTFTVGLLNRFILSYCHFISFEYIYPLPSLCLQMTNTSFSVLVLLSW
mgnify:CR=1 FL=1